MTNEKHTPGPLPGNPFMVHDIHRKDRFTVRRVHANYSLGYFTSRSNAEIGASRLNALLRERDELRAALEKIITSDDYAREAAARIPRPGFVEPRGAARAAASKKWTKILSEARQQRRASVNEARAVLARTGGEG